MSTLRDHVSRSRPLTVCHPTILSKEQAGALFPLQAWSFPPSCYPSLPMTPPLSNPSPVPTFAFSPYIFCQLKVSPYKTFLRAGSLHRLWDCILCCQREAWCSGRRPVYGALGPGFDPPRIPLPMGQIDGSEDEVSRPWSRRYTLSRRQFTIKSDWPRNRQDICSMIGDWRVQQTY